MRRRAPNTRSITGFLKSTMRPVHVIIVAFNGAEELRTCLASVTGEIETTVIDNSSSPEVRAVVEAQGVRYVDPGENLGFGAGVNHALRQFEQESPRDILLLNPDAVLKGQTLDVMRSFLHRPENENVGGVAPRLLGDDDVDQRVSWPFPTPWGAWVEAAGLGASRARSEFVIGAVLLLRWEAFVDIGLFDERFFLYAEETDWQRRGVNRGWSFRVCQDAIALHAGAGTSTVAQQREALFHAGQETYIRKWYGSGGWAVYRTGAVAGAIARTVALRGQSRRQAAHRALLYARGPRKSAGVQS